MYVLNSAHLYGENSGQKHLTAKERGEEKTQRRAESLKNKALAIKHLWSSVYQYNAHSTPQTRPRPVRR